MKPIQTLTIVGLGVGLATGVFAQGTLRERLQRRNQNAPTESDVPGTLQKSLEFENLRRTFLVHTPLGYNGKTPLPLVLNFHGGMGSGQRQERATGFSALADRENFIVVYPDGVNNQWNDGRGAAFGGTPTANDVGFVAALLDFMGRNYQVDTRRIYATGVSNGGIFSQRLGLELSDRFAAIGTVVANLAVDPKTAQPLKAPPDARPISVLMINGTADPLVKWDGGTIPGSDGRVASVAQTVAQWVAHDGCHPTPRVEQLPDQFPDDGTTVRRESYGGGKNSTEVVLYAIVGGGHGWHGPNQRGLTANPVLTKLTGTLSREVDSTAVIWDFFKNHPKP